MSKFMNKIDTATGKIKVVNKGKIWMFVPILLLLLTIIMFSVFAIVNKDVGKGINLGLDFTGGSSLTVTFGKELTDAEFNSYSERLLKIIDDVAKENGSQFDCSAPQKTGSGVETGIYIKYQNGHSDIQVVNQAISDRIEKDFSAEGLTAADNIAIQSISASSAKKLLTSAIIAIVVIWAVILVYIIIRFELWSGIAAVIALFLDVLSMVCCTIIFHVPVNTTFVAAVITIVAYSINNTIVVFDRVREHVKASGSTLGYATIGAEVDKAVSETFTRSLATTITTLITVVLLAAIGVSSIREFCLPVIFGLLFGVFDSLFIAPSVYVAIRKSVFKRKENKKAYVPAVAKDGGESEPKPKKKKYNVKANVSKKYKRINK